MPAENLWQTFFSPSEVLVRLGLTAACRDVVDFGCGYGTFAIPAAYLAKGRVYALDIDPDMVAATAAKAQADGIANVLATLRDFVAEGTGLPEASADYAMLFNILHAEDPSTLLREARRVLRPGGRLGVMHWNHDASTPRGPSMSIRPRPEQCRRWALDVGFAQDDDFAGLVDLPPYHYGWVMRRP